MRYAIRDKEAGNVIESFEKLYDAKSALDSYEKEDKEQGIYQEDFYEIYDTENCEVVD